jgi:uncharacterized HAD superfamily protein
VTKKEWLRERVFVDEYGRPYNHITSLTSMIRSEAHKIQNLDNSQINKLYQEDKNDLEMVKEKVYG